MDDVDNDAKWAFGAFIVMFIIALFLAIGAIKFKLGMEDVLEDFFRSCHKINEETIQCPIPK